MTLTSSRPYSSILTATVSRPLNASFRAPHLRSFSTASSTPTEDTAAEPAATESSTSTPTASPTSTAPSAKHNTRTHSFQTETKQILDIVTHSLYTDKEVFLRELISNASDALEKARYLQSNNRALLDSDRPFEVRIDLDKDANTLTIADTGVGMTEEELVSHLGTIARSGSKAFIQQMKAGGDSAPDVGNIIGQFGVGFYATFMVADKVEVYTQAAEDKGDGSTAGSRYWVSDGSGSYEVSEIDRISRGTRVVIHLKADMKEYTDKYAIESIIKKYSNFVGFPIYLNGEKVNTVGAIWSQPPSSITEQQHTDFYKYYASAYDTPTYRLHFSIDAPLALQALFYFPSHHMEKYGMGRMEPGVSLYSRKVLISAKSKLVLPEWLRWVKGVVDSEDLPLNISRENMQDTRLLKRINTILTKKTIKYLEDEAHKDVKKYNTFYTEYANFIKEGVCTDHEHRKDIARLLRFDSSIGQQHTTGVKEHFPSSSDNERVLVSLDDYVSRMGAGQKSIYYLSAPNRSFALSSPYYETYKERAVEVLFCYSAIDEFVMKNLTDYNGRKLLSVDSEEAATEEMAADGEQKEKAAWELSVDDEKLLLTYVEGVLKDKASSVTSSKRVMSSPAIIVHSESSAMRRMLKYVEQREDDAAAAPISKQKLELNVRHPIMLRLVARLRTQQQQGASTSSENDSVGRLVVEQVFDNACVVADLMDNPRVMVGRLNELLIKALESTAPASERVKAAEHSASEEKGVDDAQEVKASTGM